MNHTMPVWQGDFSPQHLFSDFWATLKAGFIWRGEIKGFTKESQLYWLDVTVTPILQASGEIIGFFIVGYDITQKKSLEDRVTLLEAQLQLALDPALNMRDTIAECAEVGRDMVEKTVQYERLAAYHQLRYQLVIQGACVGIWDFDIETNEMYASARFYELLGYREGDFLLTQEKFFDLLHPDDRKPVQHHLQLHLQSKEVFDLECSFKTKQGEYRWFRCTGQAAFDDHGLPIRMVGAIQDIHRNKVYEQKLKRSNEDLDQFAYIASHDLREPLRGMQNFSQFLLEDFRDSLDDEGVLYLETIKKLGERLESYLDSLLYYARFDREGMAYRETDLDILLHDVIDMVKVASPDKSIFVHIHSALPTIRCDRNKMREIFSNLFRNAVKYTVAKEKQIDIYYRSLGEGVHEFSLKDNGIGIVPELQGMIFTLFKRLHPKEAFGGGVGMGLTIVKRAVERHGGRIWVESDGVNGSTFYFTVKESDGHGF